MSKIDGTSEAQHVLVLQLRSCVCQAAAGAGGRVAMERAAAAALIDGVTPRLPAAEAQVVMLPDQIVPDHLGRCKVCVKPPPKPTDVPRSTFGDMYAWCVTAAAASCGVVWCHSAGVTAGPPARSAPGVFRSLRHSASATRREPVQTVRCRWQRQRKQRKRPPPWPMACQRSAPRQRRSRRQSSRSMAWRLQLPPPPLQVHQGQQCFLLSGCQVHVFGRISALAVKVWVGSTPTL